MRFTTRLSFAFIPPLLLMSCAQSPSGEPAGSKGTESGPATFLALGDSYTIGESVASDRRWPVLLVRELRESGMKIGKPTIVAKTGWTTGELAEAMSEREFEPPYDLVTLLVGVNDQYRGHDVDRFRQGFESLLERAVELAGDRPDHVIVISIPDWGVTPFARKDERGRDRISDEINRFNREKEAVAMERGVRFVNVTGISRRVDEDITLVANDGLHPSARQYEFWVSRILPVAREALGLDQ